MPINKALADKATRQEREAMFARRMKAMCQPKEREGLYDVVSKFDGSVIQRAVPLEHITSFGTAAMGYKLVPVN